MLLLPQKSTLTERERKALQLLVSWAEKMAVQDNERESNDPIDPGVAQPGTAAK